MITNYDKYIQFQILDKHISLVEAVSIEVVADNFGNICCHFTFDTQWDGVGKTARFIYNGQYKDVVLDVDGDCYCPNEVIKKGRFYVGVYGGNLKTSTPIAITVAESILSAADEQLPDDPTPGVYSQIMTIMQATMESADEATEAANEAVDAAEQAIEALNNATEELEEQGYIKTIKDKHKGVKLGFWIGTQAEYDALSTPPQNCYVIITDDTTYSSLAATVTQLDATVTNMANAVDALTDRVDLLEDNIQYTPGNSIYLDKVFLSGVLSLDSKEIHVHIPLNKPVRFDVTSVVFRTGSARAWKSEGGYLLGNSNSWENLDSAGGVYTAALSRKANGLYMKITKQDGSAFSGTNNQPIALQLDAVIDFH